MSTIAESFDEHWVEDPDTGCYIWQRGRKGKEACLGPRHGYGCFRLNGRTVAAHKFAYEREYGPIKSGLQVRHQCHVTVCVNPAHMKVGTNQQNVDDKIAAGRQPSKLTENTVRQIKLLVMRGWRFYQLADYYKIVIATVQDIAHERTWKHVKIAGYKKPTHARDNGRNKLNSQQVKNIRLSSASRAELAACHDVSYACITDILLGRTWGHI